MTYADRMRLYTAVEVIREGPLMVYVTSSRGLAAAQMASVGERSKVLPKVKTTNRQN